MAAAYTQEFLVNAFLYRYQSLGEAKVANLRDLANRLYNDVGRDRFRVYCSLDAQAVREYKLSL